MADFYKIVIKERTWFSAYVDKLNKADIINNYDTSWKTKMAAVLGMQPYKISGGSWTYDSVGFRTSYVEQDSRKYRVFFDVGNVFFGGKEIPAENVAILYSPQERDDCYKYQIVVDIHGNGWPDLFEVNINDVTSNKLLAENANDVGKYIDADGHPICIRFENPLDLGVVAVK